MEITFSARALCIPYTICLKRPAYLYVCIHVFFCVPDAHFFIGQQVTQSADTTSATIRRDHVFMKQMQKATAAKTAPTVPLHTDHMTCVALFMISGAKIT